MAGDLPRAITPEDFPVPGATSVLLGRDLFFDPILSGNKNISCATCHNPQAASADAVALTLGEGAVGLGPARKDDIEAAARIARHTPALFNLGAAEFKILMHDGRVAADASTRFGFGLPDGRRLERPVTSALAAQALMPMVAPDEMAGQPGSNPVADAVAADRIMGLDGAWDLLARRVNNTPAYRQRFDWLIGAEEPVHIAHIAQVLADFITYEFRATDSPFDAFLRGDDSALGNDALRGMSLFYGKANCAACHAGPFQTDHDFHAIGMPQIGPGKGHGAAMADHGRGAVTGNEEDNYRFRTPSLRNVALTAPYGHSGAYATLDSVIRHHADPMTALAEYMGEAVVFPGMDTPDLGAMEDFDEALNIAAAIEIAPVPLSDRDVAALIAFLEALTDPVSKTGRLGAPDTLPSGLPLDLGANPPS
ncbi:cytochrome-c peroxidase [Roseovarius sp. 2305UL8-3]|uniref:cytochrome-c peroxidase n=1 Tax=Roseovarius conchicola TaxID=3121636 RepID=UPI003528BDE3